ADGEEGGKEEARPARPQPAPATAGRAVRAARGPLEAQEEALCLNPNPGHNEKGAPMPVQVLNRDIRDEIFRRTLAAVKREVARTGGNPEDPLSLIGSCLEFAWQGYLILKDWPGAPRTIIQAGSAQWPRIRPEMDDGVSPTHFAYEWDGDSA